MLRELVFFITKQEEGLLIGKYLKEKCNLTQRQISSLKFREGGILKNGIRARVSEVLADGDELRLCIETDDMHSGHVVPVKRKIEVLYEDEDVICLWKERGIPVHPGGVHYQDSLTNHLLGYFDQKGEKVKIRSIGRLDLDTEGIMVFAKNQIAAAHLWSQKERGIFWKEYEAICEGGFKEEAFHTWQHLTQRIRNLNEYTMCLDENGKEASTEYLAVETGKRKEETVTRIRVRIHTGRMHQIRVHMAGAGHAIVGDPIYGNGSRKETGLRLAAVKTSFLHPYTGKRIELEHRSSFCIGKKS